MKKVLITGGDGILAQYVKKSFTDYQVLAPEHKELDITDEKLVNSFFEKNSPDIVLHLAAKTDVDWCEKNSGEAFLVNGEGTKNIAKVCKDFNSFLVYVSTAAIFNGKKDIFYEDDEPDPINIYGRSKLQGEKYIQEILDSFLVVRAAWLIGGGKKEKKFVSYVVDQLNSGAKEIRAVSDKYGTITYAKELSDLIKELILNKKTGIYHYGSRGVCSRFDIAREISKLINPEAKVIPVESSYFSNKFSAPRPNREVIGSKKIEFKNSWEKSLENYLRGEIMQEYGFS